MASRRCTRPAAAAVRMAAARLSDYSEWPKLVLDSLLASSFCMWFRVTLISLWAAGSVGDARGGAAGGMGATTVTEPR